MSQRMQRRKRELERRGWSCRIDERRRVNVLVCERMNKRPRRRRR